jgi:hypothetical protein
MKRLDHWDTRAFHNFLIARAQNPFVWGENDCALFCADGIEAMTGVDIAKDFRGKYHDEASAFALIKTVTGGETVADAAAWCAKKAGLDEWKRPLFARRGDLVVVNDTDRTISGLIHLSGRHVVAVGERGLKRLPLESIERAWHV